MQQFGRTIGRYRAVMQALGLASLVSISFYIVEALGRHDGSYWYLVWNLFLAWLPLLLATWLMIMLPSYGWNSWPAIILTLAWLGFLPNSFYLISDFIHLAIISSGNVLYDAVMILSFALNGLLLGFLSLYIVHRQLLRRLAARSAHMVVAAVLLLTSFAMYLGRDLRWNSWDVLTNPGGILFDVSDRILHPFAHPATFTTTLMFFVLLGGIYVVGWQLRAAFRGE